MILGKPFITPSLRASNTQEDHRWADAVAGLRRRYRTLGECIRWFMDINPKGTSRPMQQLIGLRQEATMVLQELIVNLEDESLNQQRGAIKLLQHAQMLKETNRRIDTLIADLRQRHPSFHAWMTEIRP